MKNLAYPIAKLITRVYMIAALGLSYIHIVHLFQDLGLHGWQSYIAPAFLDGFAVLGMLCRGEQFSADTRRLGFRLQAGAGLLSLAANIAAGDSIGGMIFGFLVVGGFVLSEAIADRVRPVQADLAAETKARRSAAAQKAAATRKAGAAQAPAAKKARKAPAKQRPTLVPVAA
jgi:hypothetical protein